MPTCAGTSLASRSDDGMTRVLITGAGGFTGRYLAPALANAGAEVHGTVLGGGDRDIRGFTALHETDLTQLSNVRATVEAVKPNVVFHLAGISFAASEDLRELYLNNIVGTRFLLEGLRGFADLDHVIVASSANVYGNQKTSVLTEDIAPCPANDYGVSKLATEHVAAMFGAELPITVVRPFNYTGRGQPTSFLIPKIVDHFRARKPVIDLGNTDVERDFSDVRDVSDVYCRLMQNGRVTGGPINICSGKAISPAEVIHLCSELTGHQIDVRVNPAFVRATELKSLRGSRRRLEESLGSVSIRPFSETLSWMLEPE